MIPFDFQYYRPSTYLEAIEIYESKEAEGKKPLFYGGGTEIVTFSRKGTLSTGAVIDIKQIPEANVFLEDDSKTVIGAALSLNEIVEKSSFELMNNIIRKIADHTVRNRLSWGGNICGRLAYREAVLPIMLTEGKMVIATKDGIKKVPVMEAFDKRMKLDKGELLLQVEMETKFFNYLHYNERKEKHGEIDYPLIHVAAINVNGKLRFAFSGICAFPFRSYELEEILNDKNMSFEERAKYVANKLPSNPRNDVFGSGDFRKFLLENSIINTLERLEGGLV